VTEASDGDDRVTGLPKEYFFVSDLHIGGDEQLKILDFEDEFVEFLKMLEQREADTELVIIGDAFGLWEFTTAEGTQKFDLLVGDHAQLFEQFRATGEHVKITLIPGNHDYELACYPGFVERLGEYGIVLEQEVAITRKLGGKKIWIEHGMQRDPSNYMPDFGNPHANPVGYFVTHSLVGTAGQLSGRGRYNWLRDIQSVTPLEEIPRWLISNYFYREMSPWLRYAVVPFLILFTLSVVNVIGLALEASGIIGTRMFLDDRLLAPFGFAGSILGVIFTVNTVVIVILLLVSIPLLIFYRDVKKTLVRFDVLATIPAISPTDAACFEAAKEVFASGPEIHIFIYGHTHNASLKRVGERVVINTGTWLKKLERVPARSRLLPSVYRPSFRLNYFKLSEDEGRIAIDYERIRKAAPRELSLLQRLVSRKPGRDALEDIPKRTVIG
jgi:UDP-2,3-diacylglucosamine pyrophosphatase LpxH